MGGITIPGQISMQGAELEALASELDQLAQQCEEDAGKLRNQRDGLEEHFDGQTLIAMTNRLSNAEIADLEKVSEEANHVAGLLRQAIAELDAADKAAYAAMQ